MSGPVKSEDLSYDDVYREFDSPLAKQLREEAYGADLGQHSWVTANELEGLVPQLKLEKTGRLLDLGCGPGGPLLFLQKRIECRCDGVDLSAEAIAVARARAASADATPLVTFHQADLNERLPFADHVFGACGPWT